MSSITEIALELLNAVRVHELKCQTEADLEESIFDLLKSKFLSANVRVKTQEKTHKERELRPDIVIGENHVLLEIKFLEKSVNEIYRLYYQAIKYAKIAKETVILFVFDPNAIFKPEDKTDLESLSRIKVVHKH